MPIPKAVEKANEEAERRSQEILQGQQGNTGNDPAPDDGDNPQGSPADPATSPQQAAGLKAPAGQDPQGPGFEQQYRVLKGKYDKEVPELHEKLRQTQQAVQKMEAALNERDQEVAKLQHSHQRDENQERLDRLSEDPDIDELLKVIRTQDQTIRAMEERVNQVQQGYQNLQQAEAESAQSAEEKLWLKISTEIPDMEQINSDPMFVQWVNQPDELLRARTGETRTRQQLLDATQLGLNAHNWEERFGRVKTIYDDFKRYKANSGSDGNNLNLHVAPSDSSDSYGKDPAGQQGNIWGPASVRQFYTDARRGAYKGREDELSRLEQDLNRAQSEGRWDQRR